eukprot:4499321-Amphidinium_carterae.1
MATAAVVHIIMSLDIAGWSPTKDVHSEAMLWEQWCPIFKGTFVAAFARVLSGFTIGFNRGGLSHYWLQLTGCWQGQDG